MSSTSQQTDARQQPELESSIDQASLDEMLRGYENLLASAADDPVSVRDALLHVITTGSRYYELLYPQVPPDAGTLQLAEPDAIRREYQPAIDEATAMVDEATAEVGDHRTTCERRAETVARLNGELQETRLAGQELEGRQRQTNDQKVQKLSTRLVNAEASLDRAAEKRDRAAERLAQARANLNQARANLRQALADRDRMVEQARANRDRMTEQARVDFHNARAAYVAATTGVALPPPPPPPPPPAPVGAMYAALELPDPRGLVSIPQDVSAYTYRLQDVGAFFRDSSRFQVRSEGSPSVANYIPPDLGPIIDEYEREFMDRFTSDPGPRIVVVLRDFVGLTDVQLIQRGLNYGTDTELVATVPPGVAPTIGMPIELKRNFGREPPNPHGVHRTNRHFLKNVRVLRRISGGRDIMRVWVSICQLVGYIKQAKTSSNRGVVFAKDGIILVQRLNRGPVLVSNIIDYDSTDPHPVAAIAHWASEAARNPTRVESSDDEHDSDEEQGGDEEQDGGTDPQAGARRPHPTGSGPVTRQTRRRVSPSGMSAPGGVGGNVQPGAQPPAQQHPAEQICSREVTPTKVAAAGDATSQEDPLAVELDLAAAELTFVCGSRCGFVYKGRWSDGQAVVVKAAPRDNRVAMEELRTEIRAYHRLADLQGTVLPQLVAHGRGCIEGRSVGVLAIELISGEAFLEPGEMDKRPVLKELTTSERFACVKALAAIHRRGVVHRDVRGANLLFRSSAGGAGRTPVFIDFGFAWFEGEHKRKAMRTERADDYEWLQGAFEGESKYA